MPDPSAPQTPAAAPRLPARLFINYASDDRPIAKRLFEQLMAADALHVWWDSLHVAGGDRWKQEIDEGLLRCQIVMAVLTRTSVAPDRQWVQYEQERASDLLLSVIPCLFEPEKAFMQEGLLPQRFAPTSVIGFAEDPDAGFRRLLNAIGDRVPKWGQEFTNHARGFEHKFVGRQKDLHSLKDLIDNESRTATARQLIAIQDIGGMGKTMLAHELVRRLASRYPGGVVIEERGTDPPRARSVLRRWMTQHLKEPAPREYEASEVLPVLADFYGEMLFLFDDVSIQDFAEVKELLRAVPPLATKILTTRSEDLSNELGLRYRLERLDDRDSLQLLHARLRDRFALGHGAPTPEAFDQLLAAREGVLLELVEKVEGHPLALHLGIGALENLGGIDTTVQKLTASLAAGVDSFELETALDAADKNQSLAHSLTLSLQELQDNDDRRGTDWVRRFRTFGLFPDGSNLPGDLVRSVWGDNDATERQDDKALSGLVRRAMLRIEQASGLYFNHPVIRAYATGLLTGHQDEHTQARGRYWGWVHRTRRERLRPAAERVEGPLASASAYPQDRVRHYRCRRGRRPADQRGGHARTSHRRGRRGTQSGRPHHHRSRAAFGQRPQGVRHPAPRTGRRATGSSLGSGRGPRRRRHRPGGGVPEADRRGAHAPGS